MKVTGDTNVLVRAVVRDNHAQGDAADRVLREASLLAVTLPTFCELAWVLRSVYGFASAVVALAIRALIAVPSVATNRPAVEAGLAVLEAGGDFADGVIAHEGLRLGEKPSFPPTGKPSRCWKRKVCPPGYFGECTFSLS